MSGAKPAADAASNGWGGTRSIFDGVDPSTAARTARAQAVSFTLHGLALVALIYFAVKAPKVVQDIADHKMEFDVVFLQSKGPGGGGGGSPQPAPPKKVDIPKPTPQPPAVPVPTPTPTVPPPPSLNAPIMTTPTTMLSASGVTGTFDVPLGGGGKGGGVGSGNGNGLGPGEGGGFGGGAYHPGNGVENPVRVREIKPAYTSEAMRAKIQGSVEMEVLIGADGKVQDARVTRSLDRVFGLDQRAKEAAMATPFLPCKKDGKPVACLVTMEMLFTLR